MVTFQERCESMLKRILGMLLAILVVTSTLSVGIISALAETELDAEFEAALTAEGFPDSYKPMLRELHKKYPNWKFVSLKTGLDFNTVVSNEYILGDSLIEKTTTPAWKSYDSGRYDFSKSSFATFDGGAYHAASREYLAYCIDPRNFLTDTNVLMFWVAYGQVGETAEGASTILSGLNWTKTYPNENEVVYIYEDGSYDIIIDSKPPVTPPEPETTIKGYVKEIVGTLNVRASATTDSSAIGSLLSNDEVLIVAEEEGKEVGGVTKWYKIKYGSGYGYVHSTFITVTTPAATVNEESSSSQVSSTASEQSTSSEATSSNQESSGNEGGFVPTKPVKEKIEIDSYGKAFYAAYKITGISAYMMASRVRQEQGLNGNISGMGKVSGYEGYYNLWNMNTSGDDKYVKGAKYAKEQGWDTPLKSIIGGASDKLLKNYFQQGQDTLYLHKYDVVKNASGGHLYWHEYMTYLPAPWNEAAILRKAFTDQTIQNEYVFKIPIYNNMPSSPAPCPKSSGTNNNYLKSISIAGKALPNFYVYTQTYTDIIIDYAEKVNITATAYDSGATVAGGGDLELKEGINTVKLTVTASNGHQRVYTLNVFMNQKPADPDDTPPGGEGEGEEEEEQPKTPEIKTEDYNIGDYITKIEPNTKAQDFITKLAVTNGSVKIFGNDDAEKSAESLVATGDKVVIYTESGEEYLSYIIVIYGDVNSDGKVNSIDLLGAQRHIVGIADLSNAQKEAADSNKDKKLNSVDLLSTQRYIVGIVTSIQGE